MRWTVLLMCLWLCRTTLHKGMSKMHKLQTLVYDILPSITAVFSYAIGSRKLSANEQFFFVGAQTVVSLLQTTQIKQGVLFIAANKVYTSANKTTIVSIETELFFLPGVDVSHVYLRALALACFYSHVSTHTPSIVFRHLPPNSVRTSYITEGALFISAQLSTDAVSALRKVWILIRLWK